MLNMTSPAAHRTLVLGGARSGKSRHAEQLLDGEPDVVYVATGQPPADSDPDWAQRVAAHRASRPPHWRTVETIDVADAIRTADAPVLIDCLATWLTRVFDTVGAWHDEPGWRDRASAATSALLASWSAAPVPVIAVSNEVGSGIVPSTPAGRLLRDELGWLNQRVAAASQRVVLLVAGIAVPIKQEDG